MGAIDPPVILERRPRRRGTEQVNQRAKLGECGLGQLAGPVGDDSSDSGLSGGVDAFARVRCLGRLHHGANQAFAFIHLLERLGTSLQVVLPAAR